MSKSCIFCGAPAMPNGNLCQSCENEIARRIWNPIPGRCPVCGARVRGRRKYCGPICYHIGSNIKQKEAYYRNGKQNKRRASASRLDRHIQRAKELGISYGMYMAKLRGDGI